MTIQASSGMLLSNYLAIPYGNVPTPLVRDWFYLFARERAHARWFINFNLFTLLPADCFLSPTEEYAYHQRCTNAGTDPSSSQIHRNFPGDFFLFFDFSLSSSEPKERKKWNSNKKNPARTYVRRDSSGATVHLWVQVKHNTSYTTRYFTGRYYQKKKLLSNLCSPYVSYGCTPGIFF